jgi:hypothetical protein
VAAGWTEIELLLPQAIFVDVEAALEGAHRTESCMAEERWADAWGPAGIAYHRRMAMTADNTPVSGEAVRLRPAPLRRPS